LYDIEVVRTSDSETTTLAGALYIVDRVIGPQLEASLEGPDVVRPGWTSALWIKYTNTGDAPMTRRSL